MPKLRRAQAVAAVLNADAEAALADRFTVHLHLALLAVVLDGADNRSSATKQHWLRYDK